MLDFYLKLVYIVISFKFQINFRININFVEQYGGQAAISGKNVGAVLNSISQGNCLIYIFMCLDFYSLKVLVLNLKYFITELRTKLTGEPLEASFDSNACPHCKPVSTPY